MAEKSPDELDPASSKHHLVIQPSEEVRQIHLTRLQHSAPFCVMRSKKSGKFNRKKSVPLIEQSDTDPETLRLLEDQERAKYWKRWGPYLSERQWGTVREDYSADGSCWDYFSHDHARSRAYRWGEDGLMGICDRQCRLCFSVALWNGKDPILKERLFGLTGPQGNHGEDVKECYYYLDSTPTHSYMKALYKYPMCEYPYSRIEPANREAGLSGPEVELEDMGVFEENRYWDVFVEYAKSSPDSICIRITCHNRSNSPAKIHVIPQLWYRNTWVWGYQHEGATDKPLLQLSGDGHVYGEHNSTLGKWCLLASDCNGQTPEILFTENETNYRAIYGMEETDKYTKDAFHRYVVNSEKTAVNPGLRGTKCGVHHLQDVDAHSSIGFKLILCSESEKPNISNEELFGAFFEKTFQIRRSEAKRFYSRLAHQGITDFNSSLDTEQLAVVRQSYAGLLWTKQFYHYSVRDWLKGDPKMPDPDNARLCGRNADWGHLFNREIISMPDKWEYPWYASWDLAFHMIPFAKVDPNFAKEQLILFLREWYMHPNGQIPAYEFAFNDVNPPVHAWACFRVYKITGSRGTRDHKFLARTFQKLVLNFNWWVNRKDPSGKNIFAGGFLGLDNIGLFDRSRPLPEGWVLEQADGTAWMAFFCIVMLDMALELAHTHDEVYEDMASKFFEHFIQISDAMNQLGQGKGLWHEEDGFYYDLLRIHGQSYPMKIRSIVGIIPIFACLTLEERVMDKLSGFKTRLEWFIKYRPDLSEQISVLDSEHSSGYHHLLAIPSRDKLVKVLRYVLDEKEFLSPYGIRSLSKAHENAPFVMELDGEKQQVQYVPGESNTYIFGGNSNWRGPIWVCINYLLIESLERYYFYFGEDLKVECPVGSGSMLTLYEVSIELSRRLTKLFLPDETGRRPCHGDSKTYQNDPFWKDLVLFYEYFHGDSGRGCGASHQTGWTALITRCFDKLAHH